MHRAWSLVPPSPLRWAKRARNESRPRRRETTVQCYPTLKCGGSGDECVYVCGCVQCVCVCVCACACVCAWFNTQRKRKLTIGQNCDSNANLRLTVITTPCAYEFKYVTCPQLPRVSTHCIDCIAHIPESHHLPIVKWSLWMSKEKDKYISLSTCTSWTLPSITYVHSYLESTWSIFPGKGPESGK